MTVREPTAAFASGPDTRSGTVIAINLAVVGWIGAEVSSLSPLGAGLWWTSPTLTYAVAAVQSLIAYGVFCWGLTHAYHRYRYDEPVPVSAPSYTDLALPVGVTALSGVVAVLALPRLLGVPLSGTAPFVIDGVLSIGSTTTSALPNLELTVTETPLYYIGRIVEAPGYGVFFEGGTLVVSGLAYGLLFHGVIQRTIEHIHSTEKGIVGTAMIVAVLSGLLEGVPVLLVYLAIALTAAYAFHRSGTLLVPMVTYGLFNLVFYVVHALAYVVHVRSLP